MSNNKNDITNKENSINNQENSSFNHSKLNNSSINQSSQNKSSVLIQKQPKVLFICKKRSHSYGPSFGLINSCRFICNALRQHGIEADVVSVIDNNNIDAEVTKFKPTHCFIEALWVVPNKFKELIPIHPKIEWYIRIHSKIPFLANEGIAVQWLREYDELSKNPKYKTLHLSANHMEPIELFKQAYDIKMHYHPNIYYPAEYPKIIVESSEKSKDIINIGCFGSIRPMKNQLLQALAAINFGNLMKKTVRFHINGDRIEQKGDPVLKNLENAFKNTKHELVKHPWLDHEKFVDLVRLMDIGMQVSFSETFNIVAADFVWNDIPIVGSDEVSWLSYIFKANSNNMNNIVDKLSIAWYGRSIGLQRLNKWKLNEYNCEATIAWLNSFK